jgi:hypothetical protein
LQGQGGQNCFILKVLSFMPLKEEACQNLAEFLEQIPSIFVSG